MSAVNIALEVEYMDFQQYILLVESRAAANICHTVINALMRPVLNRDPHGINAKRRLHMVLERQISGGESDGAAPLVALLDMGFHRPPMAEQLGRAARITLAKQLANAG